MILHLVNLCLVFAISSSKAIENEPRFKQQRQEIIPPGLTVVSF